MLCVGRRRIVFVCCVLVTPIRGLFLCEQEDRKGCEWCEDWTEHQFFFAEEDAMQCGGFRRFLDL